MNGEDTRRAVSKKAMENRPVTDVFTSPQIRAMETAKAVASSSGSVVIPVKDLMEINYGSWEGKTEEELLQEDRALYEAWWSHPAETAPPGAKASARSMSAAKRHGKR